MRNFHLNARIPMPLHTPLSALEQHDEFIGRHIGPCATEMSQMLADIGAASLDQLIDQLKKDRETVDRILTE